MPRIYELCIQYGCEASTKWCVREHNFIGLVDPSPANTTHDLLNFKAELP